MNLEDILAGWNGCSGSGGGGGSTEALIFSMVGDYPYRSSVTFGEIYNAFMGGRNVFLCIREQSYDNTGTYYALSSLQIYANDGDETIEYSAYLDFNGNLMGTPESALSIEGLFPMYLAYTD
jgi:hypothetical protein